MNIVRSLKDLCLAAFQRLADIVAALAMEHPVFAAKFIPVARRQIFCVLPKPAARPPGAFELPLPPREIWENIYATQEEYLAVGRKDVDTLRALLHNHQASIQPGHKVMELGCATGRLLRWFQREAEQGEFWGLDINATYIAWCQQHLSPPFHFATTTTFPHLPFSDDTFDLIYAGSVFSHVSELVDAWFLELRRILKAGGRLYITVHDNHTIHLLRTQRKHEPLAQMLAAHQARLDAMPNGFAMFTIRRSPRGAQVFYDLEYLCARLSAGFDILATRPEAYGHQTGILLKRR